MIYVGIDPADESFTACAFLGPADYQIAPTPFSNNQAGFTAMETWLKKQDIDLAGVHFCVENTGVYSEALCYRLHERGLRLSLVDPGVIWKAFPTAQPKNDFLDARKVAEYGFRYRDRLRIWEPRAELVEQISVVLSTREQLVHQKTATQNSRSTLARKRVQTPAANRALEATLQNLKEQISQLDEELKRLIRNDPNLSQGVCLLMSAPGVGWLLSAHFVVLTRGFTELPQYRQVAQYLGISPNEHTSGTSIRRRSRSRGYGPPVMRKLLHLAARSLRTHDARSKTYFLEKTAAGKPKTLVLNNIANKLLRQLCGMLRSNRPFDHNYRSSNPRLVLA